MNLREIIFRHFYNYEPPIVVVKASSRMTEVRYWPDKSLPMTPLVTACQHYDNGFYYCLVECNTLRAIQQDNKPDLAETLAKDCLHVFSEVLLSDTGMTPKFARDFFTEIERNDPEDDGLYRVNLNCDPMAQEYAGLVMRWKNGKIIPHRFSCPFRQQVFTFTMRGLSL